MTTDFSNNNNDLILNGKSKSKTNASKKSFNQTSSLFPIETVSGRYRPNDRFGHSVATDGIFTIVGAPGYSYSDDDSVTATLANAGGAMVFQKIVKPSSKITKQRRRQKLTYTTAGIYDFVVPEGVKEVTVQLIGAGGGGTLDGAFAGGNGGYTKATFNVQSGKTYKLIVGEGGVVGGTISTIGGGGYLTAPNGRGGSGGGRSAFHDILYGDLITAGGGGGAGKDGPGGYGGLVAGDGAASPATTHPVVVDLRARGANRYVIGYNNAWSSPNYFIYGVVNSNLTTNYVNANSANLRGKTIMDPIYMSGDNAVPYNSGTLVDNPFNSGAGGGGYRGGAAGTNAYGYRAGSTGAFTAFACGGSGSGGSSMAEVTPGFGPNPSYVKNVTCFDGDKRKLPSFFDTYGIGGTDTTKGTDGVIIVEYDYFVETVEETTIVDWKQVSKFAPTSGTNVRAANNYFGTSVAIAGEWAFMGGPGHAHDANGANSLTNAGAVWVYRLVANTWTRFQKIVPTTRAANSSFGTSLAFNGTKLFVGSTSVNGSSSYPGSVYSFTFDGTSWVQEAQIIPTGTNASTNSDFFGHKLAIDADTLLVSSVNGFDENGDNLVTNAGSVWVYDVSSTPVQVQKLVGLRTANSRFGNAISIKGNTISIEASGNSASYVFKLSEGVWTQTSAVLDNSDSDIVMYARGTSIAADGTNVNQPNGAQLFNAVGITAFSTPATPTVGYGRSLHFNTTLSNTGTGCPTITGTTFTNLNNFTFEVYVALNSKAMGSITTDRLDGILFQNTTGSANTNSWNIKYRAEPIIGSFMLYFELLNDVTDTKVVQFDIGRFETTEWKHLAIVRDGNELRTYVHGIHTNTYDITGYEFDMGTHIIRANNTVSNGAGITYRLSEFRVRNIAAYKASFSPDPNGDTKQMVESEFGRGSATLVLDDNTILSGAPKYSGFVPIKAGTNRSSLETPIYNMSLSERGKVDIKTFDGTNWATNALPIIANGSFLPRLASGNGWRTINYGDSVAVRNNKVYISALGIFYDIDTTRTDRYSSGSVMVYDVQNNFKLIDRYVNPALGSGNNALQSIGITTNPDDTILLSLQGSTGYGLIRSVTLNMNLAHFQANVTNSATGAYNYKGEFGLDYGNVLGRIDPATRNKMCIDSKSNGIFSWYMPATSLSGNNVDLTTGASWSGTAGSPNRVYGWPYVNTNGKFVLYNNELWSSNITLSSTSANWGESATGAVVKLIPDDTNNRPYSNAYVVSYPGDNGQNYETGEMMGFAVGISGTDIIVGRPKNTKPLYSNTNTSSYTGSTEVFRYSAPEVAYKNIQSLYPTSSQNWLFGSRIDTRGNKVTIGTSTTPQSAGTYANSSVFVYTNGTSLTLTQQVDNIGFTEYRGPTTFAPTTYLNSSLNFFEDSDNIVVGSPDQTSNNNISFGKLNLLELNVASQQYTINPTTFETKQTVSSRTVAEFGASMVTDGTRLLVGAPRYNLLDSGATANQTGAGFMFVKDGNSWAFKSKLMSETNIATGTLYGTTVDLNGEFAILTSYGTNTTSMAGYSRIFNYDGSKWKYQNELNSAPSFTTRSAVMISPTKIIMGAPAFGGTYTTSNIPYRFGAFNERTRTSETAAWATTVSTYVVPFMSAGLYDYGTLNYNTTYENEVLMRSRNDFFGEVVRFSNDKKFLIVSATGNSYAGTPLVTSTGTNYGSAYIYYWDDIKHAWRLNKKQVSITNPSNNLYYGSRIERFADSGFMISQKVSNNSGAAFTLTSSGTGPSATFANTVIVTNTTSNALFGSGMAYDDSRNLFYIGSPGATQSGPASGYFETVTNNTAKTRQVYQIDGFVNNRNQDDQFGTSVSVFKGCVAVGVPNYKYNYMGTVTNPTRGGIYTYVLDDGSFTAHQKITFETTTTTSNGLNVGMGDGVLFAGSTNTGSTMFTLDSSNTFQPTTIAPVAGYSMTFASTNTQNVLFDNKTNTVVMANTNPTYPETPDVMARMYGAAFTISPTSATSWTFNANPITSQTKNGANVLEPGHVLSTALSSNNLTLDYARSMVLSPDGSKLAIAASFDGAFPWYWSSSSNTMSLSIAGTRYTNWGRIYVYEWNPHTSKYDYHSFIMSPTLGSTNSFGASMSWADEKLVVSTPGIASFVYEPAENATWKLTSSNAMENNLTQAVIKPSGENIVMSLASSYGYPLLANSGAIGVLKNIDGVWRTNRGIMAGSDAETVFSDSVIAGGGGGGALGGFAGGTRTDSYGAFGGTNKLPESWEALVSPGNTSVLPSADHTTGAGGTYSSDIANRNGKHGYGIITFNTGEIITVAGTTGDEIPVNIPNGATVADIQLWGAGGGAAGFTTAPTSPRSALGGAGGFIRGSLNVSETDTLLVRIGLGGSGGRSVDADTSREQLRYDALSGAGARSRTPATVQNAGYGGGASYITFNGDVIAIAAGGGGGGNNTAGDSRKDGMPGGMTYNFELAYDRAQNGYSLYSSPSKINLRVANERFGYKTRIFDDNRLFIGAPGTSQTITGDTLPQNSGSIQYYKKINGSWELQSKITDKISTANAYFGYNFDFIRGDTETKFITLSGRMISTMNVDLTNLVVNNWFGSQRYSTLSYKPTEELINVETTQSFTTSQQRTTGVAAIGSNYYLGTPMYSLNMASPQFKEENIGGIQIVSGETNLPTTQFTYNGSMWSRNENDKFGTSVAISGNNIFVGAPGQDVIEENGVTTTHTDIGAVFKFTNTALTGSKYPYVAKYASSFVDGWTLQGSSLSVMDGKLYVGVETENKLIEMSQTGEILRKFTGTTGSRLVIPSTTMAFELFKDGNTGFGNQIDLPAAGYALGYLYGSDGSLGIAKYELNEIGYSNGIQAGDMFGKSVFAGKDFIVSASPYHKFTTTGAPLSTEGALFVYGYNGVNWNPEVKLTTNVIGLGQTLGGRDNYIITSKSDETDNRVEMFQRVAPGEWASLGGSTITKDIPGLEGNELASVESVAIADANRAVAGIPMRNGTAAEDSLSHFGAVALFKRDAGNFTFDSYLSALGATNGRGEGDMFGASISSSRAYVVVGSPEHAYDEQGLNSMEGSGAVWIYARTNGFPLLGKFVAPERNNFARFGAYVSIDNVTNNVAIAESGRDLVHVFVFDGANLTLDKTFDLAVEQLDGAKLLGFNNNILVVGQPTDDSNKGIITAYKRVAGQWDAGTDIIGFLNEDGTPMTNASDVDDMFGYAVDIDPRGNLIIGVPGHQWDKNGENQITPGAGAAYIRKL